jgi:ketopantoate reductase
MPAWLLPAVKLILPHVGTIVAAATPHFTKRKSDPGDPSLVQQQIAELQAAVSENAALVKELAEQLQLTVTALEQAAAITQERVRRLYAISVAAMLVALVALFVAVFALMQP